MERKIFDEVILKMDCYKDAIDVAEDIGASEEVIDGLSELFFSVFTGSIWSEIKRLIKVARDKEEEDLVE